MAVGGDALSVRVQYADAVVLRAYPDVSKPVFKQNIDFIAANVAVGVQVVYWFAGFVFEANDARTAG